MSDILLVKNQEGQERGRRHLIIGNFDSFLVFAGRLLNFKLADIIGPMMSTFSSFRPERMRIQDIVKFQYFLTIL